MMMEKFPTEIVVLPSFLQRTSLSTQYTGLPENLQRLERTGRTWPQLLLGGGGGGRVCTGPWQGRQRGEGGIGQGGAGSHGRALECTRQVQMALGKFLNLSVPPVVPLCTKWG